MNKRTFLKGATAAALSVVASRGFAQESPPRRRRDRPTRNGIWIPADVSHTADDWKRLFARMRVAGIDGVLLQVYDGRHAYWDSARLPVKSDRMKTLLPLAKEAGLEVHAWMRALPCFVEDVLARHPDWYTRSAESAADASRFLEPAHPEVRAFLKGMVAEVAALPDLAGVHLDDVRYPDADHGGSAYNRAQFEKTHGVDPLERPDEAALSAWRQYRLDALTELVNDHLVPAAHAHERALTAAVLSGPAYARETALQDWPRWTLNAFFPLLFPERGGDSSEGTEDVRRIDLGRITVQVQEAAAAVTVPVCAGLRAAAFDFAGMARVVRAALEGGASGVSLYDLDAMTEDRWMGVQVVIVGQRPD